MRLQGHRRLMALVACGGLVVATVLAAPRVDATEERVPPAPPAAAATVSSDAGSQQQAAALLRAMTQYLAGLPSFSFGFRAGYDVVQPSGQKIEFGETRRVSLLRPDRLRVEQVASNGLRDVAIFDGRTISVLNADAGVYAQAPQPGSIDDSLAYFVRDLRMRMPLALLLNSRLPEALQGRVKSLDYVERTSILGIPVHHIAGRTANVDFQFWITTGEGPLPLRVVITYTQAPGQPQFWADMADWNVRPAFAATTFQFEPPANAGQIAFAVQVPQPASEGGLP